MLAMMTAFSDFHLVWEGGDGSVDIHLWMCWHCRMERKLAAMSGEGNLFVPIKRELNASTSSFGFDCASKPPAFDEDSSATGALAYRKLNILCGFLGLARFTRAFHMQS